MLQLLLNIAIGHMCGYMVSLHYVAASSAMGQSCGCRVLQLNVIAAD